MAAREVFISYAAGDPDWPPATVRQFAEQLQAYGVEVHLDVFHEESKGRKLSLAEWRDWMHASLNAANPVLCLCSHQYAAGSRRDPTSPVGRGVAFESFGIVQQFYLRKQHNHGWVWLVFRSPAEAAAAMPEFLDGRCPEYFWDTEQEKLLRNLAGGELRQSSGSAAEVTDAPSPAPKAETDRKSHARHHVELTNDRLTAAPTFWKALKGDDFDDQPPPISALTTEAAFVQWLSQCSVAEAQNVFFALRRALKSIGKDADARPMAEDASVALYMLAACRLVKPVTDDVGRFIQVPDVEQAHLYCAIIATSLAGGKLDLVPSGEVGVPKAEFSFSLQLPPGDNPADLFERSLYAAIFNTPHAAEVALGEGELPPSERAELRQRLQAIRRIDRSTLVLHLRSGGGAPDLSASKLLGETNVPLFLLTSEATHWLVDMEPRDLIANIKGFWAELHHRSAGPAPIIARQLKELTLVGNARATAVLPNDTPVSDWQQVLALMQTLADSVQSTVSHRDQQSALLLQVMSLLEEARAPKSDSKARIRQGLEDIKHVADAAEGGQQLVGLAGTIIAAIKPFLSSL